MDRVTILLLIGQLSIGGAERQFVNLARSVDRRRYRVLVGVLSHDLALAPELEEVGVEVHSLHHTPRYPIWDLPGIIVRLRSFIMAQRVDLVHTFLYPANVVGTLAAAAAGAPVVMSERSAPRRMALSHRLAYTIVGRLAASVVVNSYANRDTLNRQVGIPDTRIEVHWNGVDFERLARVAAAPEMIRERCAISPGAPVVGTVCRIDRLKHLELFVRIAAACRARRPDLRFVIVGGSTSPEGAAYVEELRHLSEELGLEGALTFAGLQPNSADWMRMLDLFLLTSVEEGTPNALLEAQALGVPALSTDVGDVRRILAASGGGMVLPPEPMVWAEQVDRLLGDRAAHAAMGADASSYIAEHFQLHRLSDQTQLLWQRVLDRRRSK